MVQDVVFVEIAMHPYHLMVQDLVFAEIAMHPYYLMVQNVLFAEIAMHPYYLMVQDVVFTEIAMHEVACLVQSPDDDDHFSVKAAHALRGKARVPQPGRRHAVVPDELHDEDVEAELDRHRRIDPSLKEGATCHDSYERRRMAMSCGSCTNTLLSPSLPSS